MNKRYPNTKLGKTRFLLEHGEYNSFIPETKVMSRTNLKQMLGKYGMVYVKPDKGTGGFGVMRVKREKGGNGFRYGYHLGNQTRAFPAYEALFQSMSRKMGRRTHLVQKGIHMLKVRGRPFDVRVMVQKNEKGKWEQTGMIGRLAHPKKAVTNFHRGGTPLPVGELLKPHLFYRVFRLTKLHGRFRNRKG